VSACQAGSASEDQAKRTRINGSNRVHGPEDVPVFFDGRRRRKAKVLLRSDNVDRIVAHALSLYHQGVATITEASREAALHPNDSIDRNLS
jgi:hypothetical protein